MSNLSSASLLQLAAVVASSSTVDDPVARVSGIARMRPCRRDRTIEKFAASRRHYRVSASGRRAAVVQVLMLIALAVGAGTAQAGNAINQASTGPAGSAVVISNITPTQLLGANPARYGWTIYCAGTAGTVAALVMPGSSSGKPANPAPSQTVGFPIPANTLMSDQDFPLRGLDAIHQRIDAQAQGSAPIGCYTWEEQ